MFFPPISGKGFGDRTYDLTKPTQTSGEQERVENRRAIGNNLIHHHPQNERMTIKQPFAFCWVKIPNSQRPAF
eukprot:scaffold3448_cov92-Cylindrotheca_fusiformis.AAC.2